MRTGLSCPWARGAVGCWIMLASLRLLGCGTAGSGPWRWCACGPPVSAGPGSGIRPPSWGWPSASSVCLHCGLCTSLCQCIGGGSGGEEDFAEDPGIIAFGGGGGSNFIKFINFPIIGLGPNAKEGLYMARDSLRRLPGSVRSLPKRRLGSSDGCERAAGLALQSLRIQRFASRTPYGTTP